MRCPGTEQKNLYVPALRLSDRLFVPPLNVGVAPTFSPDEDSTVTLCGSGALFVKSIDTLPAFALSDVVSYFSWPSGFASRLTLDEPPEADPLAGAGVEAVVGVVVELVVGACAAVLAEELELDEELPQPASASSTAASAGIEIQSTERFVA